MSATEPVSEPRHAARRPRSRATLALIAVSVIAAAAIVAVIVLATAGGGSKGTGGHTAPGASSPYCPGILHALPAAVPASADQASGEMNDLTNLMGPGPSPLDSRVLTLEKAIEKIGLVYTTVAGLAGDAAPTAQQAAAFWSAESQLRAYCG